MRTHPHVAGGHGAGVPSPRWEDGAAWPDPLAGELRTRPADVSEFRFEIDALHELRGFVARAAAGAGLSDERAEDLILAASEVAANSIVHGGGSGRAHAWSERGALHFESRDGGRIADPLVGRTRPTPTQSKGRGLWMANQLCDLVQIRSSEDGTVVRLRVELD
jgi:anti-sigma regulatory factor (Ser/Thr protein kinase)